ncbi:MAG: SprT-like domain-containing protein [Pseudomonadales bacterium]
MADPTDQLYRAIGDAFDYFNKELFTGSLPKVIFTVQRKKGVLGYFAPDRWGSKEGKSCHEIALNPAYLAQSRTVEIFQTLVHEMVHCWQFCQGSPGRIGYHNKEWAYKMIEVGLMPSSGSPGGAITGQSMSDYILEDGEFYTACFKLVSEHNYHFSWIDRLALPKLYPERIFKANKLTEDIREEQDNDTPSASTKTLSIIESKLDRKDDSVQVGQIPDDSWLDATFSELLPEGFITQETKKPPKRYRYCCPGCDTKIYGRPRLRIKCMECNKLFQWNQYQKPS